MRSAWTVGKVVLLLPLVYSLLAKVAPAPPPTLDLPSRDERSARYAWWNLGLGFGALALSVPLGLAVWLGLRVVAAWHAWQLQPADLVWVTGPEYFALPAVVLALASSFTIYHRLGRLLLGMQRHAEFVGYLHFQYKYDQARVARTITYVGGLLAAALAMLGLGWSVRLSGTGFTWHGFLAIGEAHYRYADVRSIVTAPGLVAPNGHHVVRREYVVRFADGRGWTTRDLMTRVSPEEQARMVSLLSVRSGVAIQEVPVFQMTDFP